MIQYDVELTNDRVPCLVKEKDYGDCGNMNGPSAVKDMLCLYMRLDRKAEEYVYLIALSTKGRPIAVFFLSKGVLDGSFCRPREIMQRLLLVGAAKFILAHNHPSGDIMPSEMDIMMCRKCKEAGVLMDIPLCDFMIIGNGNYYSMKEEGLL